MITGSSDSATDDLQHAIRYTAAAGMLDLGLLPGTAQSVAFATSADGSVVVGGSDDGDTSNAFRWTLAGGTMQSLGELGGNNYARAYAISPDGTIVGGAGAFPDGDHAFVWTATLGIVDLNTYLPSLGADLTGWQLIAVRGFSADSSVIVGEGTLNGAYRAFLVRGLRWCNCHNPADVAALGGAPGCDGQVTADDIVYYLAQFFAANLAVADIVGLGGAGGPDGQITPDDLVAFLAAFFAGCP